MNQRYSRSRLSLVYAGILNLRGGLSSNGTFRARQERWGSINGSVLLVYGWNHGYMS